MANYITKEGMQQLRKRMQELIKIRSTVIKQVVTARDMGDLSENAEYHAARERQRHLENEFNNLKKRIDHLQVIDDTNIPKDAVRFGARVLVKELKNEILRKVRLVGADEIFDTEDEHERVSILSPVGKPMIGKKVGDHFTVIAPIGKREFEILEIK
ncbi:MAG: transcription elongation factor GreA [Candidatus Cloacimonetes bacterium]|jgi:transcription elongation factor GreA|nr:transcription elongation factor GreA [Candidatus Cloacimonadota bacterium]